MFGKGVWSFCAFPGILWVATGKKEKCVGKMDEKLVQMNRFDDDLVVFTEGTEWQLKQVDLYGEFRQRLVNVWDFLDWLITRKMYAIFAVDPKVMNRPIVWLKAKAYALKANWFLRSKGLLLPWKNVDNGKPRERE